MGNNTAGQKFSKCCFRIGAAAVCIPTILAGFGIAIAGSFATLAMWVPGLVVGLAVGAISKDHELGASIGIAVTESIKTLGQLTMSAGVAASVYAAHGDTAFENKKGEPEPENPSSYVYR